MAIRQVLEGLLQEGEIPSIILGIVQILIGFQIEKFRTLMPCAADSSRGAMRMYRYSHYALAGLTPACLLAVRSPCFGIAFFDLASLMPLLRVLYQENRSLDVIFGAAAAVHSHIALNFVRFLMPPAMLSTATSRMHSF